MLALVPAVQAPLAATRDQRENSGISKVLDKVRDGKPRADSDAIPISTPSFIKWATVALALVA
jgi:hypothetical protein